MKCNQPGRSTGPAHGETKTIDRPAQKERAGRQARTTERELVSSDEQQCGRVQTRARPASGPIQCRALPRRGRQLQGSRAEGGGGTPDAR